MTSGIVTGVATGSGLVSYTLVTGCSVSTMVTVGSSSVTAASSSLCLGGSTTLSGTGGTWSGGSGSISVTGPGIINALAVGVDTAIYTVTISCGTLTTLYPFIVNPVPPAITGTTSFCVGSTTTLGNAIPGGAWTTGNASVATISGAGVVTGVSAGTATMVYVTPGGCTTSTVVTVGTSATPIITGPSAMCVGMTTTFAAIPSGGTWTSSSTAVVTVSSFGVAGGLTAGSAVIAYTSGAGCGSSVATATISITPIPSMIGGASTPVCVGTTSSLTNTASGGSWSTSVSAIGTIDPITGVFAGVSPGSCIVTYSFGAGCNVTALVTVISSGVPVIVGVPSVCTGSVTSLSATIPGGIWSSSSSSATVGTGAGIVTGVSAGTAVISYATISCSGPVTVTTTVTVSGPAPIGGSGSVCIGWSATLTNSVSGGTWVSSNPTIATINPTTGVLTALTAGTCNIIYTLPGGCSVSAVETVNPSPAPITGITSVCVGSTGTLADATPGGIWASGVVPIATIGMSTGIYTGITAGTSDITYTLLTGCSATTTVTVNTAPTITSGSASICVGAATTYTATPTGGTWTSSMMSVATIGATSGVVSGIASGVSVLTYSLATGCAGTAIITINPLPTITAASTYAGCGSTYTLTAAGGVTYSWTPTAGLSCAGCGTTTIDPAATTTFTVMGTDAAGCVNGATVTVNGNRINGVVSFSTSATDTAKVWLIQFNPSDSSITGLDSVLACDNGSGGYFEFDSQPSGNYLVKAMLLGSVPGTSGYMPTYSSSTPNWYSAASASHTSGTDVLNINMIYGTVPTGPGFISGYVYLGAGKGTAGLTGVPNMLIQLKNASGTVIAYTYTNAAGAYSFTSLAYGSYVIYPEDYHFHTTASTAVGLNAANPGVTAVSFKQYPVSRNIIPFSTVATGSIPAAQAINVYPNPTNGLLNISWNDQATGVASLIITDVIGRQVYSSVIDINTASGTAGINLSGLVNGIYHVSIKSENLNYSGRLQVQN